MTACFTELDIVARRLAAAAGVRWDDLSDYPGYARNVWRDQARTMIVSIAPGAIFAEGRRALWD